MVEVSVHTSYRYDETVTVANADCTAAIEDCIQSTKHSLVFAHYTIVHNSQKI